MKICVSGTSCIGKSTFIKDFLEKWPMYSTPPFSYREMAEKNNIKINKLGDLEGQRTIRDILIQQIEDTKDQTHVIYDRGPLDNLVYSIWHNFKNKGGVDDLFIEQSIAKTKEAIKNYDIIFFMPITKSHTVDIVDDNLRDTDPEYRKEIDNIFKGIIKTYHDQKDIFFDMSDTPAIIEIFGNREERIQIASLYISNNGSITESDQSIADPEEIDLINNAKSAFKLH
jgi:hypothetical protein